MHYALNRGRLLVDEKDQVYWVGRNLPTPLIRKYSAEGRLLQEIHPASRLLEDVSARAGGRLQKQLRTRAVGGMTTLNSLSLDRKSGDVWVFPAAPEVLVYDASGRLKRAVGLKAGEYPFGASDALILGARGFIATNTALGSFLFELPGNR